MVPKAILLTLPVLLAAGCASHPDAPIHPASSEAAPPSPPSALPAAIARTDTMHFLDAPHMTAAVPTAAEPTRLDVPRDTVVLAPTSQTPWVIPRPAGLDTVVADAVLWVDIEGTVANGDDSGCFWNFRLGVDNSRLPPGTSHAFPACVDEPPIVPTGIRALHVHIANADIAGDDGQVLKVELTANALPAPGSTVQLLTGSLEQDSSITIHGLQLPVDTTTLLA